MPKQPDPSDTSRLHLREPLEDTANLRDGLETDPESGQASATDANRYADGIIRFYRARTILTRGARPAECQLAWTYLSRLEPRHLPPGARPAFFALVHFMHGQTFDDSLSCADFKRQVFGIATIIDGLLDDLG
jgi:hypothetical protein